jgi:diguanylate cyclase (GGDEF)-like protein
MADHDYFGTRTLLSGKIVWNFGQSTVDCTVRNLSDTGARLQVESTRDLPDLFELTIGGRREQKTCKITWRSDDRIGVAFMGSQAFEAAEENSHDLLRSRLLALRAALDDVEVGVVLLDADLRAQFINKAFRQLWKLPDDKADARVPFIALMYHGRDTRAYEIPNHMLDDYVAGRVERVRAGDMTPMDIRLADGRVLRLNGAILPNGGRLLTYTLVTDIVRQSDRLRSLTDALDCLDDGIMLFDAELRLEFINRKALRMWSIPDDVAQAGTELQRVMEHTMLLFDYPAEQVEQFVNDRLAAIRGGDPAPADIRTIDGKIIRAHCTRLTSGQRMLTYCDVTDLVRASESLRLLATTDPLTALNNRRHFLSLAEAEWDRFQRYHRPLTLLMLDIDHFKNVNDQYGHACGDDVIRAVANAALQEKRSSDVAGRLGGEEFAVLLPETNASAAVLVAERIRKRIAAELHSYEKVFFRVTVSIGIAEATASMSGIAALLRCADISLYSAKAAGRNQTASYSPPSEDQRVAAQ